MPHTISSSRDSRLASVLSHSDMAENDAKLNQLAEVLSLDTNLDNEQFLAQFRSLKQNNSLVNELCQRRSGFIGLRALAYACKSDKKRAERYKNIITQLKTGLDKNNRSYFATNNISVCRKVEALCNDYLTKSYDSKDSAEYKQDKLIFDELSNFNKQIRQNINSHQSPTIFNIKSSGEENSNKSQACLNYSNDEMWNTFIRDNMTKELVILTKANLVADNMNKVNIHGVAIRELANEALGTIKITENSEIFNQDGELNQNISNNIRKFVLNTELKSLINKHETNEYLRSYIARLSGENSDIGTTVDNILNELYKKIYPNANAPEYIAENKFFNDLNNFRKQFTPDKSTVQKEIDLSLISYQQPSASVDIWTTFIAALPARYSNLNPENLSQKNIDKINIEGISYRELANEVLKVLGIHLDSNESIFTFNSSRLNSKISNAIKLQKILKFIHDNKSAYLHSKVKCIQVQGEIIGYSYDIDNTYSGDIGNVVSIMRKECFKCNYDNAISEVDLEIFNILTNMQNSTNKQSVYTLNVVNSKSGDSQENLQPVQLWDFFINSLHESYHGLIPENLLSQNINKLNIQGKTFKELASRALRNLGLDENIEIFDQNGNVNNIVCDKIKEYAQKRVNSIQLLQNHVRKLHAERSDYRGGAPTLRENGGEIVGYRINRRFIKSDNIKFVPSNGIAQEGTSKTLTHKTSDSDYPSQELKNPNVVGLTLKNPNKFNGIDRSIFGLIKANHLDCFIIQYRMNEIMLISQDVGNDIHSLIFEKQTYIFDIRHFAKLATQLDTLHKLNIVHRDLKLENMGIVIDSITGEYYVGVFDNDTMIKAAEALNLVGTEYYTPTEKFLTKDVMNDIGSQINRDKYNFLVSMIIASNTKLMDFNLSKAQIPDDIIEKFVIDNIKLEHQQSIRNFLRLTHRSNDEIRNELGLDADVEYYKKIDAIPPLGEILNLTI